MTLLGFFGGMHICMPNNLILFTLQHERTVKRLIYERSVILVFHIIYKMTRVIVYTFRRHSSYVF